MVTVLKFLARFLRAAANEDVLSVLVPARLFNDYLVFNLFLGNDTIQGGANWEV